MPVDVAVIPVAGLGTRLLPLTKTIPKELLPLGRKPVLQHVTEEMQAAGVKDLVMVTSQSKLAITEFFSRSPALEDLLRSGGKMRQLESLDFVDDGVDLHYVDQQQQLGLGHAVLCAREMVGNRPFFIALGDAKMGDANCDDTSEQYVSGTTSIENNATLSRRMVRVFEQHNADAVISFQTVPLEKVSRYGIAMVGPGYSEGDEMFTLTGLVEKPSAEAAPSQFAVAARYLCKPEIFNHLASTSPGHGGEIQLTDAIASMIADGGKVLGIPLLKTEKRYDVGNFESYFAAFLETALNDPEIGESLKAQLRDLLAESGDKP